MVDPDFAVPAAFLPDTRDYHLTVELLVHVHFIDMFSNKFVRSVAVYLLNSLVRIKYISVKVYDLNSVHSLFNRH